MTLFDHNAKTELNSSAPLATRMRPHTFDEFVGQQEIAGPGRVLRRSIESGHIPSMILWGPPGTGKTTIASLIARSTDSHFNSISAVLSGVADLRNIMDDAKSRLGMHGQRTIVFIDEIHRFNKSQQDVILPHVEKGTIILIGATTENPSFEVVSPLLSRSRVFPLNPLTESDIEQIINRAINDKEKGLGSFRVKLRDEVLESLVKLSNSDARMALNTLELAVHATVPSPSGERIVTRETIEDSMQKKVIGYDKKGDHHYDTISAFIKSVRGSDPNAAVYWLARMLDAGEDPLFIARRIIVLSSEDIGMANPQALPISIAAQQAVSFLGMPEGRIPLAEATVYLATSPKSNSAYSAIDKALNDVREEISEPVPYHLRNAETSLMKEIGYGKGYKYSHNYENHFAPMNNLPSNLQNRRYYIPTKQGYELTALDQLAKWWGAEDGIYGSKIIKN